MAKHVLRAFLAPHAALWGLLVLVGASAVRAEPADSAKDVFPPRSESIVHNVKAANERLQMTVNSSRILTLGQKIPQAQVNNPDILTLTPLSPTEIQISAKKPGVTEVNLWDEKKQIYTVDVIVFADARELTMLLRTQFPDASLKVIPVAQGVMISGYVDQPDHVSSIVQIAEEFYPKVIPLMTVSGVQQVLLHVKVMEVSRTKLRNLGFDFAQLTDPSDPRNLVRSSMAGLLGIPNLSKAGSLPPGASSFLPLSSQAGIQFGVVQGTNSFFGVLEALRQDNLLKILAEPTLVTVSGRPAFFQVGGEVPVMVPQSLGTISIQYKKFGTQLDFVPIVLGNGRIRLEVRPRITEPDRALSIEHEAYTIFAFKTREVDTGVELQAGQTLALAGLVQTRIEAERRQLPWIGEMPYVGALFRRVEEKANEVELLILVTPELAEPMDAHEVPPCGPGMRTASPDDCELFVKGYIEVPNCCPHGAPGTGCAQCNGQGAGMQVDGASGELPGMIDAVPEAIQTPTPGTPPVPPPPDASAGNPATLRIGSRAAPPYNLRNRANRHSSPTVSRPTDEVALPGFLGAVGYDVLE